MKLSVLETSLFSYNTHSILMMQLLSTQYTHITLWLPSAKAPVFSDHPLFTISPHILNSLLAESLHAVHSLCTQSLPTLSTHTLHTATPHALHSHSAYRYCVRSSLTLCTPSLRTFFTHTLHTVSPSRSPLLCTPSRCSAAISDRRALLGR